MKNRKKTLEGIAKKHFFNKRVAQTFILLALFGFISTYINFNSSGIVEDATFPLMYIFYYIPTLLSSFFIVYLVYSIFIYNTILKVKSL